MPDTTPPADLEATAAFLEATALSTEAPALAGILAPLRACALELREPIAQGGMGAVWRAYDPSLCRTVAVKFLLEHLADRDDVQRRFLSEARTTGRLQHPGIPPVHELGQLSDGRPYLAMKLIEGQTLHRLLRSRPTPAHDLPRFVKIFEQIAQTLAYAHSQGVIHRDLKPANIMVGAFAEVQVMDWGLARDLSSASQERQRLESDAATPGAATPGADAPGSPHAGAETQAGSILGTPAYMPPEQARGEPADARADVFGLGAVLCEILTGRPPFVGDITAVLHQVARGDVAEVHARLAACGADAELIALATTCLQADREQRPANGQAVADVLGAYLHGVQERLRQAEVARAEAVVQAREESKRRRVTLALAGVLLLATLAGGLGWSYWQVAQADQRQRTEREITLAEGEAMHREQEAQQCSLADEKSILAARDQWQFAAAALDAADRASAAGLTNPASTQRLATLRERISAGLAQTKQAEERDRRDRALLAALDRARQAAITLARSKFDPRLPRALYTEAFKAHGRDVTAGSVSEVADWLRGCTPALHSRLVYALLHWSAREPDALRDRLRDIVAAVGIDPWGESFLIAARQEQIDRLREMADEAREGHLPGIAREVLAQALGDLIQRDQEIAFLVESQRQQPDDFWLNFRLGSLLARDAGKSLKRLELALGYLRAAAALSPNAAAVHNNLGNVLVDLGDLTAAEHAYRQAIRLEANAICHFNLALLLEGRKDFAAAERSYRAALEIEPDYAWSHENLALLLCRTPQGLAEALDHAQRGVKLDGENPIAHRTLGAVLEKQGDRVRAEAAYRAALERDANSSNTLLSLAQVLAEQKKNVEAERFYRRALEADREGAAGWSNLALLLSEREEHAEAIECAQKAVTLESREAVYFHNLGVVHEAANEPDAAQTAYRKAIDLDGSFLNSRLNLGRVFGKQGNHRAAAEAFESLLAIDPKQAMAHANLGIALGALGQAEKGLVSLKKAIELEHDYLNGHVNLAIALRKLGRFEEMRDAAREAVAVNRKQPPIRPDVTQLLARAEHLVKLDQAIPVVLRGEQEPTVEAWAEMIQVSVTMKRDWPTALKLYARPPGDATPWIENPRRGLRFLMASVAVLQAGVEREPEASQLRDLARMWLRADLAILARSAMDPRAATNPMICQSIATILTGWKKDADLAPVRERVEDLPEAERAAWRDLWREAEELLRQVGEK